MKVARSGAKRARQLSLPPAKALKTLDAAQRKLCVPQAVYARQRKCDPAAVHKRTTGGQVDTYGPKRLICPPLADAQWQENVRARADSAPAGAVSRETIPAADQQDSYNELRRRRERAELEKAELEAARLAGRLIDREVAIKVIGDFAAAMRDRVEAVARRAAPGCLGLDNVREIQIVIAAENRRALAVDLDDIIAALAAKILAA